MSRSYHQRHRDSRKGKAPREILGTFTKDGKPIISGEKGKLNLMVGKILSVGVKKLTKRNMVSI